MTKVSVFLPTRSGSERVTNKNTRKFSIFNNGLLELKLSQLLKVENINQIVLSTNDRKSIEIASSISDKIIIIERPDNLGKSTTKLSDLIAYVPKIILDEHILWTHVTSPFVDENTYTKAINLYFDAISDKSDSLMSVVNYKNFLWDPELKCIMNNKSRLNWPRTQDLVDLYEIDSAIFINSRSNYIKNKNRIGQNPYLFKQSGLEALDIDNLDDFLLAEYIYNMRYGL